MGRILRTLCLVSLLILQDAWGKGLHVAESAARPIALAGAGPARVTSDLVSELRLRSLGPALKPGRVADIAVDPRNRSVWYLANGSGGLWKTTNRGNDWQPIFDDGGSYSLGCVTIDDRTVPIPSAV